MTKHSTQSRERGQGGDFIPFHLPLAGSRGGAPLWDLGQRPNCCSSNPLKKRSQQGAGSEASLPVTLRIRRCAPQLALSITSTLSRPLRDRVAVLSYYVSTLRYAGISPLRRRRGGNENRRMSAVALWTASQHTPMLLDFYCCRGIRACGRDKGAATALPLP